MIPDRQRSESRTLFGDRDPSKSFDLKKLQALGYVAGPVPVWITALLSHSPVEISMVFPAGLLGMGESPWPTLSCF